MIWCYGELQALQRIQLGESYDQIGKGPTISPRSWHRSILSGRFRRASSTESLECKQSKVILLLINISMINRLVCYIRNLYFLLLRSHKCLNLNSIMPEVLGLDDLSQLTFIRNSHKCLNLNLIMLEVLRPDDLRQLILICSSHKCLNLNSIMPEILEPDDLGQLTLIRSSHKCLNLNPIMPEILEPDDLGQLTLIRNSHKYLNLRFNHI